VLFYGLSTCIWCKRTREFLEGEVVAFEYVYVDKLEGDERTAALEEIQRHNPSRNFPTIVIDGDQVIVGYKIDALKGALGLS